MTSRRLISVFAVLLMCTIGHVCSAQDCPLTGGAPGPANPPTTTAAVPPAAVPQPAASAPTTNADLVFFRRATRNAYGGGSPADPYLQALSMSPMAMMTDLAAQQAAIVQQQQARTAARKAMREPARARLRQQNALRYYAAGMKAEAAGNYAAARKYYARAAKVDGGAASDDAREALAAIGN